MRIMIVDDEQDICDLACRLLHKYAECITVSDGKEAIAKLEALWAEGKIVDCIFLDLLMPGMDGISILKEIRTLEYERVRRGVEETKIIILTSSNRPKHIVEAFKEQSDGYIVKPFDEEKLVAEMKKLGLLPN